MTRAVIRPRFEANVPTRSAIPIETLSAPMVLPISFNGLGVREFVATRLMPEVGIGAESALAMQLVTYLVQVGSFQKAADADRLKAQLALLGFEARVVSARISVTYSSFAIQASWMLESSIL